MADSRYSSVAAMMGQSSGSAGVPTQGFNAANIIGTPPPVVGNIQGGPGGYKGAIGQSIPSLHIVLVAVGLIAVGYLAYHFNFEK